MPNNAPTSNNKLSKKTIVIVLSIVFLIVGLIASFIVVQQSVDLRNRASELSCRMNLVKCEWKWEGDLPPGVDRVEYEYSVLGPCNSTEQRPCSGITDNTSVEFEGYPGGTYTCNVEPKIFVSDQQCPAKLASGLGSCPLESTSDGSTNINVADTETPQRVPGESCSCSDDGGSLNCNATEQQDYRSEDGAGLIVLDPVYEVGDNACFACQKLRVKDSSGKLIREVDGCSLGDEEEEIRLHQAPSEAGKCETYTVEAIGGEGEQETAKTCQTCNHSICCPACVPPQNLDVEIQSSDPSKQLDTEIVDSCSFQCDFDIDFGQANQCGVAGETVELTVPEGGCVDIDDDYAQTKNICDTDNDGKIEFEYSRGGVYDIALDCSEIAVSNVSVGGDSETGGVVSSLPSDFKCKKRVSVACGVGTPNTSSNELDDPSSTDAPVIPGGFDDLNTSEDLIITPPLELVDKACRPLNVELICHNCSQE